MLAPTKDLILPFFPTQFFKRKEMYKKLKERKKKTSMKGLQKIKTGGPYLAKYFHTLKPFLL